MPARGIASLLTASELGQILLSTFTLSKANLPARGIASLYLPDRGIASLILATELGQILLSTFTLSQANSPAKGIASFVLGKVTLFCSLASWLVRESNRSVVKIEIFTHRVMNWRPSGLECSAVTERIH